MTGSIVTLRVPTLNITVMKLKLIAVLGALIFVQALAAQIKPDEISASFFKKLKYGHRDSALHDISKNLNPSIKLELTKNINTQFQSIDSLDKLTDWIWICDMEMTKDLISKSYLLKYNKRPYRFDLLFYKKGNIWYVQDASTTIDLFSDLRNAGRVEKIRPNNLVITY
jgi:hypothetical protein